MKKQKVFKADHLVYKPFSKTFDPNAAAKALYDTAAWRKYSAVFLSINTRCYSCGSKSEVVDHIEAHKGNKDLFEKLDNHLPLCHRCHNTVTGLFDRHQTPKTESKLKWLAGNRARNGVFDIRVKVLPKYVQD